MINIDKTNINGVLNINKTPIDRAFMNRKEFYSAGKYEDWVYDYGIPLEYIESTGTQYINTKLNYTSVKYIENKAKLNAIDTNRYNLIGGASGSVYWGTSNGFWRCGGEIGFQGDTNVHIFKIDFPNKKASVDGVDLPPRTVSASETNIISLFTASNTLDYISKANVYYNKMYDSQKNIIQHLIPMKKHDGTICMFDLISKEYYENKGTGSFIAGPEI